MKKIMFNAARVAFCSVASLFVFGDRAFAYVDPATTSYVVQIVAGIIIACGTGIGIFWNRMRRKLKKKDQNSTVPDDISAERNSQGGVMTAEDLLDDSEPDKNE
jgi:DNA-directed RNA polymerase subunit N (RpoN/RPB10)